ncbi:hypothetical protein [Haloarcula halophila]|nr:hypothetical protein [Halomicroarcula sp. DFY41]
MPDAARGMQVAEGRGWFDLTWEEPMCRALTIAVAWIFSGGSIDETWVPSFTVTEDTDEFATSVYEALGVGARTVREDDNGRATELLPAADASVLGRLLSALGAPTGSKTPDRKFSLPPWLDEAPEDVRLAFAQTFVVNRGVERHDRPQTPVQLRTTRSDEFRDAIQALCESVTAEEAVTGDSEVWRLTDSAADQLYRMPGVPTGSA